MRSHVFPFTKVVYFFENINVVLRSCSDDSKKCHVAVTGSRLINPGSVLKQSYVVYSIETVCFSSLLSIKQISVRGADVFLDSPSFPHQRNLNSTLFDTLTLCVWILLQPNT